jgi:hypothetical protein
MMGPGDPGASEPLYRVTAKRIDAASVERDAQLPHDVHPAGM